LQKDLTESRDCRPTCSRTVTERRGWRQGCRRIVIENRLWRLGCRRPVTERRVGRRRAEGLLQRAVFGDWVGERTYKEQMLESEVQKDCYRE